MCCVSLALVLTLLSQFTIAANGGGANGFSPFDSLVGVERFVDNRQLLLPTLNFTCNATIVGWTLALASTISDVSPAGSIALQVWRNMSRVAGEEECLELVQEVIYSEVLSRDEQVQLTLRDSRYFVNVSEGDFLGFFLYEEGLSPLYDPDSLNMTVLRSTSKESQYCFINGSISPDGESTRHVSPMVMVELATLQAEPTGTPNGVPNDEFAIPQYVVYILSSLLAVVTLVLIGCTVVGAGLLARRRSLHKRAKTDSRHRTEVIIEENELLQKNIGDDDWLLSWKHASLGGCFAQDRYFKYHRGTLSGAGLPMATKARVSPLSQVHVSVKVVKDHSSEDGLKSFWERVLLLKKVASGNHRHVAQLLGCIVQELPAAIFVEYSAEGDLLTFLRAGRMTPGREGEGQSYPTHLTKYQQEEKVLLFAQQIASGMEYLFSVGVSDHTLSCWTILMAQDRVLKVASFDPSPDVRQSALKWSAPEVIKGEESTEKSHMWSYGLTLWEICTQGDHPCSDLGSEELAARLADGRGVSRPKDCPAELYDLMLTCWRESPQERPIFAQIHSHTRNLRDQSEQHGYAPVFAAGRWLMDGGRRPAAHGGRVTSRPADYMPTLAGTMEPLHSYAALVKGNPVAGEKEGKKKGMQGGQWPWRGRGI